MMKPVIAISSGDPAGIGPEITVKAIADKGVTGAARCVVAGSRKIFELACAQCRIPLRIHEITDPAEGEFSPGILNLIPVGNIDVDSFEYGTIAADYGKAAYQYIEACIGLALTKKADAVCTAPIHKEALKAAGVPYIGHTEMFAALTKTDDPLTMFETRGLRVFFLTRHVSLRQACDLITKERIIDYVKRCFAALERLGVTGGTMAVAGLNPHSGEHGLFGKEETEEIEPAVSVLKQAGYRVEGPVGADSVFHFAQKGRYAAVLSLYHDQGHIAAKTLDFERTVAITNGMPILRTSVDHGTAFDIAGTGTASAVSMKEAILLAAGYAANFR